MPAPAESIARHLEDDKGKQHAVRHHFASWFMMPGGQLQALQTVLRHASLTMTLRHAHLSSDHLRSEMTKTERSAADSR